MALPSLSRSLTVTQLFVLAFGTIIGVGWIITLGELLAQAGSLGTLLAFLVGAAVMLVIALSYAEIGNLYPATGGEIAYNLAIFNMPMAFAAGWCIALVYIATTAFEAISAGWLLSVIVPGLEGPVMYEVLGTEVHAGSLAIGLVLMAAFGALNYLRASVAARAQEWMTWSLLIATACFVLLGVVFGRWENVLPLFGSSSGSNAWAGFLTVLSATPFFYIGFNVIPQALGERQAGMSARMVNTALIGSVLASLVFYVGVVVATVLIAPRDELLRSELPVAAAFENAFRSAWVGRLVLLAGLFGLLSTWNAVYFAAARVLYAFGRAGVVGPWLGRASGNHGTPANAIVVVGVIGAVGTAFGRGAIMPIVNATSCVMMLVLASVCFGLVRSRRRHPALERPFRLPWGEFWGLLGGVLSLIMCVLSLYQAKAASPAAVPPEWIVIAAWCAVGGVLWTLSGRGRRARSGGADAPDSRIAAEFGLLEEQQKDR